MELLSVIRHWAFRDRLSIREISRRASLSRNTICKYLRSDVVEPVFKVPDRANKLDAFCLQAGEALGALIRQITLVPADDQPDRLGIQLHGKRSVADTLTLREAI